MQINSYRVRPIIDKNMSKNYVYSLHSRCRKEYKGKTRRPINIWVEKHGKSVISGETLNQAWPIMYWGIFVVPKRCVLWKQKIEKEESDVWKNQSLYITARFRCLTAQCSCFSSSFYCFNQLGLYYSHNFFFFLPTESLSDLTIEKVVQIIFVVCYK